MTLPVPPNKGEHVRAETVRQIIDCLRMFRPLAGQNTRTRTTPGGTFIDGMPGGAAPGGDLLPWTVRKHITKDDEDGKWEIWLPTGCMSVGRSLEVLNAPASGVNGHDDDKAGWYLFYLDEDEGDARTETVGAGENAVKKTYRDWDIVAHGKTSAKVDGVDELDAPARRLLYVSARKQPTDEERQNQTDEDRAKNTWGDEFSQVVATVRLGTRQKGSAAPTSFRTITQRASAPISVAGRERTNFDLVWYFKVKEDGSLEVKHLYCIRQNANAAGLTLEGPTMTEVTDAEKTIYAKILTNPLNPSAESGTIEVVLDPTGYKDRTVDVTWLQLYAISYNAVSADFRAQSLVNLQVYR